MVILTTPKKNQYYTGEEWRDIKDYTGWAIFMLPIELIGYGCYLWLGIILRVLWPLCMGFLVGTLSLLIIFIVGLGRG